MMPPMPALLLRHAALMPRDVTRGDWRCRFTPTPPLRYGTPLPPLRYATCLPPFFFRYDYGHDYLLTICCRAARAAMALLLLSGYAAVIFAMFFTCYFDAADTIFAYRRFTTMSI